MSLLIALALAAHAADYDCDGYDDLVVGVPAEDAVQIFFGGPSGIATRDAWRPVTHALVPGDGDLFGQSLASADTEGDGCDDLAVGSNGGLFVRKGPTEDWDHYEDALFDVGADWTYVTSLVGVGPSSSGREATFALVGDARESNWDLGSVTIESALLVAEDDGTGELEMPPHQLGGEIPSRLASGDVNGNGADDIVTSSGSGYEVYHRATWMASTPSMTFQESDIGMSSSVFGDRTGDEALAMGDFDGDGYADLVIGDPNESGGGKVAVIPGSPSGLNLAAVDRYGPGYGGISVPGKFGAAVAVGDFDGDGYDDLAIGAPDADFYGTNAGAVVVLYGSFNGITSSGSELWGQDTSGIQGSSETDDHFGAALTAGDYDGDGDDDLAIGVPDEDIGSISAAGAVHVLQGTTTSGLTHTGNVLITQDEPSIEDLCEANDKFGGVLH